MNYSDSNVVHVDTAIVNQELAVAREDKYTGIELRLLPPYIKNNRTLKLWPFPGRASLYCCTIVISDIQNQLVGSMDLHAFHRVGDREFLPIDKTIYYWRKHQKEHIAPQQLHVMCAILKSKKGIRDVGKVFSSLNNDSKYKKVASKLANIVAHTVTSSIVVNIGLDILEIIGEYLGNIEDKPLGMMIKSFTHLHNDWEQPGITPIYINTKDVDFNLDLIVSHSNTAA